MQQPGFMIYVADWNDLIEDYDTSEIGELFVAALRYFNTGEAADFDDRGIKHCFRLITQKIDRDRYRYEKKCLQNGYNRYIRTCKEREQEPKSYEEWFTTVYDRLPP